MFKRRSLSYESFSRTCLSPGWAIVRESRSSHLLRSFSQPSGVRNNNSSNSGNTESALCISTAAKITHKARGAQDLFSRVLQRSLSQPASFKPQQLFQQEQATRDNSNNSRETAVERSKSSDNNTNFSDSNNTSSNNSNRGEWCSSSARKDSQVEWTHGKSAKGAKQLLRR